MWIIMCGVGSTKSTAFQRQEFVTNSTEVPKIENSLGWTPIPFSFRRKLSGKLLQRSFASPKLSSAAKWSHCFRTSWLPHVEELLTREILDYRVSRFHALDPLLTSLSHEHITRTQLGRVQRYQSACNLRMEYIYSEKWNVQVNFKIWASKLTRDRET